MKKASLKANKSEFRSYFRNVRRTISSTRRGQASQKLLELLQLKGIVASFASFGDEIDLWPLNFQLAREGRLLLPKVIGKEVVFCHVDDPLTQLQKSSLGILEPTTDCFSGSIDTILVPGLAFTINGHRLGYGKGHYDRCLHLQKCQTLGIGFREQLTFKIPIEDHDVQLSTIYCV